MAVLKTVETATRSKNKRKHTHTHTEFLYTLTAFCKNNAFLRGKTCLEKFTVYLMQVSSWISLIESDCHT